MTMARATIPTQLREQVRRRAVYRCEYCHSSEWLTGQRHHIDHIIPDSQGGDTAIGNLCLACATCNGSKRDRSEAIDPATGKSEPLFNPRTQRWQNHFAWSDDGTVITGLTPTGRATVVALRLNRPLAVSARKVWVAVGKHPPDEG
jgi:hypothetical protein